MSMHLCLLGDATSPHVQRWALEMRQRGLRVSLVTARPANVEGITLRTLSPVRRPVDWLMRVGEVRRHVADLAPNILHAHYVTSYGYLAARSGMHPLVMTAWGSDLLVTPRRNPWLRWLTGWTLRRADLITGDSHSLVQAAAEYRPACRIEDIHWGVDLQRFHPVPWDQKPALGLVSLRAWEPNYNIDTVIDAFAILRARLPAAPLRLHLLGGGSLADSLQNQVRRSGLQDSVRFHGRLDDAGMARVLADSRISISVPSSDATSVALLESMACGLAVVASRVQANEHWIGPQWLVEPRNAPELATKLEMLLTDIGCAAAAGRQNATRIARDGDRAVQMDRMHTLYQQLLSSAGGTHARI